jgi:hypothetical protein
MDKFEYMQFVPEMKGFVTKKAAPDTLEKINAFGAEGWELVAITPIAGTTGASYGASTAALVYTFKRLIV